MQLTSNVITFHSLDGLRLSGTFNAPSDLTNRAALLLHGAGVTREEGGFFTRLATGLSEAGISSLRFDLPGHGKSQGRQEDLALTSVLNAIHAGIDQLRSLTKATSVLLIAASFSGGIAAYYAAKRPDEINSLVLLNPLIDYKQRFIDEKPYWQEDYIDEQAAEKLLARGYMNHSTTFKLGRAMLNEVFWLQPRSVFAEITAPTLIIHGTKDSFISVASSRAADNQLTCAHRLIEIDGAEHGFAVPDDADYADPQTQEWQAFTIGAVSDWAAVYSTLN